MEKPATTSLSTISRSGLAVGASIPIFLGYGITGYTSAIYKVLNPNKELPDFYRKLTGNCARDLEKICQEIILDIRTQVVGQIPKTDPKNERQVLICNHPKITAIPGLMSFLTTNFAPNLITISKKENIWHPLAILNFWPLYLIDGIIFIDRENREKAIEKIRNSCHRVLTENSSLLIFPDSRRPTQKAIEESIKKHGKLTPNDAPQYTCAPRRGGLWQIMEATKNFNTRFISVTTTIDQDDQGLLGAGRLQGSTLFFKAEDITEQLPDNENELGIWLTQHWIKKNEVIRSLKAFRT